MELSIAILALIVSVATLVWTIRVNIQQTQASALFANLAAIVDVERTLAELPEILRFHNINPSEITEVGLTPEEFSYLLASFTVGGIFDRALYANSKAAFKEGTYRYNMCASAETRRAWP